MKVGEKVFLQNDSGLLEVIIDKELNREDVQSGIGEDRLKSYESLRVERYSCSCNGDLFTFYDNTLNNMDITIMEMGYNDNKFYACHFNEVEQDLYTLDKKGYVR